MSVASKNPFALLNDDDEPAVQPKPDAPAVDAPKPNAKKTTQTGRGGGRYYQRGGGAKPATTQPEQTQAPPAAGGERKYDRGDRGDRRGGGGERGRGRGRGRGGGDNRYRDPRPDRHSATGITDSHKKLHQGWGGDDGKTELQAETGGAYDAANATQEPAAAGDGWGTGATNEAGAADPWAAPAGEEKAGGGDAADPWADKPSGEGAADAAPTGEGDAKPDRRANGKRYEEEEEDTRLTLDEYRAKNAGGVDVPKLELRKANEGSSDLFKGAVQLTKDVDANNYFVGKQPKTGNKPRAQKAEKQYIEIEARFDRPQRGGRGRGGFDRGRGRGGGDRGERTGGRYQREQQPRAVDVDDTNAFPSL